MTLLLLLCSTTTTTVSRRAFTTTKPSSKIVTNSNSFVFAVANAFTTPSTAATARSTRGCTPAAALSSSSSSSSSSLKASSFFDELSKTFSTMTDGGAAKASSKYYTVGITGASGLVGTALQDELLSLDDATTTTIRGKPVRVVALGRTDGPTALSTIGIDDDLDDDSGTTTFKALWNPNASTTSEIIDPKLVEKLDAIVHLSGENISTGLGGGPLALLGIRPWTDAKKQEIIDSRVVTTAALAEAIAASPNRNRIDFVVSSGIGIYGSDYVEGGESDDGQSKLKTMNPPDETANTDSATGFLADVSRRWEDATKPASSAARRVVNLRTAVVMSTKGGALAKLYPIFFVGGGGIVGNGKQYFPHISARDMARATVHVLDTPSLKGPVNMIAPDNGCTNQDFTTAMGTVLNRPTVLPFPAFAVSLLFGEMGEEVLLGGTRATPQKLLDSGFQFLHPTIEDTVRSAIVEEKNI
eukprot:CAMPEP_0113460906 /NCGR_PEP_ID=MMETSP0014_2-20120614/11248_1 /TAXON_ID=2857 /ORGANISM="Nitzschia sp." /LENGTH=470 /DNA_ID=CAMNT_0000352613 /DNA_START=257 /DNA_END=1669 /DNA_ORIENTATION=+ /assembly_acc=CAM_ASM_000159